MLVIKCDHTPQLHRRACQFERRKCWPLNAATPRSSSAVLNFVH
jgi:hypothetical protein